MFSLSNLVGGCNNEHEQTQRHIALKISKHVKTCKHCKTSAFFIILYLYTKRSEYYKIHLRRWGTHHNKHISRNECVLSSQQTTAWHPTESLWIHLEEEGHPGAPFPFNTPGCFPKPLKPSWSGAVCVSRSWDWCLPVRSKKVQANFANKNTQNNIILAR